MMGKNAGQAMTTNRVSPGLDKIADLRYFRFGVCLPHNFYSSRTFRLRNTVTATMAASKTMPALVKKVMSTACV
jgi:hypothetical protein